MSDVAREAGVSLMTVSRVLNAPGLVRASTRERVQSVIAELGYRPNAVARSLVTRRSHTIGVVSIDTTLYGPTSTLHGIERAAREAGFFLSVTTAETPDPPALQSAIARLSDQSVDGMIVIAPTRGAARSLAEAPPSVPSVVVEGSSPGLPCVAVDQRMGAMLATEHLLRLGHATVHHVTGPLDWLEATARVEGWREALQAAGRTVPPLVTGDWTARSGYEAGRLLAKRTDLTAVFVANDHMALGVLLALHQSGRDVPADVSVVAFDDVPESAFYMPPLTTVHQDFGDIGRQSIDLLMQYVETPSTPVRRRLLAPRLVVRETTAAPAG
jgi:DNA-binding LacI/PurR family transcriptional regulator